MNRRRIVRELVIVLILSLLWVLPAQPVIEEIETEEEVIIDDAEYALFTDATIAAIKSFNQGLSEIIEVPESESDYPYLAVRPDLTKGSVDLKDWGYEEKEYFISGKANSYRVNEENQLSEVTNTPQEVNYTDRVIVYRPENKEDFNGAVFVEILNASSGADVPNLWRQGYDYIMRSGYIYIGVTSKDSTINSLKAFNNERYNSLLWPDNGAIWDILGQLGVELKSEESPILYNSTVPEGLYLYGSSQSGWYVNSFASYFNLANFIVDDADAIKTEEDVKGSHIYDGYFSLVGGFMHNAIGGGGMRMFKPVYATDVPFILMVGENDYNPFSLRLSSNTETNKYRHYVVAGASHSEPMYDVDPIDLIQTLAGKKAAEYQYFGEVEGAKLTASDFNFSVYINAALENLHLWATKGIPAPMGQYSDEIKGVMNQSVFIAERDEYGNMSTGLLSPQIEVPYASYYGSEKGPGSYSLNHGSMSYLSDEVISSLYKDFDDYLSRYEEALDKAIDDKWILPEDREKMMETALNAPIFGNTGKDTEAISLSMERETEKEVISETKGEGYSETEYLVKGEGLIYGVMKDNLIYKRRINSFPYTNYLKVILPDNFNGRVMIDLLLSGEEDISECIKDGSAYISLTGEPETAEEKGGDWSIITGVNDTKKEFGFVWDIISQTVSDILSNNLLGTDKEITEIILGVDEAESDIVNTYGTFFSSFPSYGVTTINTFDSETLCALSTMEEAKV